MNVQLVTALDKAPSRIQIFGTRAVELVAKITERLGKLAVFYPAGSLRRGRMVLNDLDIVVVLEDGVTDEQFYDGAKEFFGKEPSLGGSAGMKKAQFYTDRNELVDFYLCDRDKLPPMMLFLTGSAETNKRMRARAKKKGMALNQYSLSDRKTGSLIGEQTERGIFDTLGMNYLEPEDR